MLVVKCWKSSGFLLSMNHLRKGPGLSKKLFAGRGFLSEKVRKERRRFKRIPFAEDDGIVGIFKVPEISISSQIRDISIGGLQFGLEKEQAKKLRAGDILILTGIKGTANIELDDGIELEIKWMKELENSGYVAVGCEFKSMSEKVQQQIHEFVNCEMRWKGVGKEEKRKGSQKATEPSDRYSIPKKHLTLFVVAVAVAAISIAFVKIFPKDSKDLSAKLPASIEARVNSLEVGLSNAEAMQDRLAVLAEQSGKLEQRLMEMDRNGNLVAQKLEELIQEIQALREKIASLASGSEASQPNKPAAAAPMKRRHHEVQKGENLYRIALKYGVSVDELCGLNAISADQVIQPGEKLIVP